MYKTKTISAQKIRTNLGEIMNEVYYNNRVFVIERSGKPMVKIVRVNNSAFENPNTLVNIYMRYAGKIGATRAKEMKKAVTSVRRRNERATPVV